MWLCAVYVEHPVLIKLVWVGWKNTGSSQTRRLDTTLSSNIPWTNLPQVQKCYTLYGSAISWQTLGLVLMLLRIVVLGVLGIIYAILQFLAGVRMLYTRSKYHLLVGLQMDHFCPFSYSWSVSCLSMSKEPKRTVQLNQGRWGNQIT